MVVVSLMPCRSSPYENKDDNIFGVFLVAAANNNGNDGSGDMEWATTMTSPLIAATDVVLLLLPMQLDAAGN